MAKARPLSEENNRGFVLCFYVSYRRWYFVDQRTVYSPGVGWWKMTVPRKRSFHGLYGLILFLKMNESGNYSSAC